jgi:hypothetical protein
VLASTETFTTEEANMLAGSDLERADQTEEVADTDGAEPF